MDLLTPELLEIARERGSACVVVVTPPQVYEYSWDSTDARWEEILTMVVRVATTEEVTFCGVVTEGVTIDNQTYEMHEHLNMTVVHRAGYECYRIPINQEHLIQEPVFSLGAVDPIDLDFDLPSLQAVLPW